MRSALSSYRGFAPGAGGYLPPPPLALRRALSSGSVPDQRGGPPRGRWVSHNKPAEMADRLPASCHSPAVLPAIKKDVQSAPPTNVSHAGPTEQRSDFGPFSGFW